MLKHGLQQNLKRRDGSCQDDQKERLFSARVVGSGGRHAFVTELVSGGLFKLRKKGMYCLLCRKHKSKSAQNRIQTFSSDPSTRFKWSTVKEHMTCAKHQTTVMNELLNQVSHFQKQVDQKESSKLVVLQEAFHAVYWPARTREHICGKLQEKSFYGLLVDVMADVSNEEQMLAFIQFFDVDQGKLE
ncbi:hypothetical protein pdam_00008300 [Pocillopora damicornis]|uniref:C17orf113 probable zinc finger domain-containing protein n=1 Tax=Pocillopora damicornis TaxID=46731 RepID=A0A3M6U5W0_POCDA|nr:hypothetical protein pdam_00008300 [Pocillopora damicornis]